MSCHLSIIGKDLDVDAFIIRSNLKPHKKTYKGQPKFKTKPDGEKMKYSFLSITISKAGFSDFNKQVKDTVRYLKRNREKLQHISGTNGVQFAVLDFGVEHGPDRFCQSNFLPTELLQLAGDLGLSIEISIYQQSRD